MHTTLVQFLSSLADSRLVYNPRTGERLSGLLKIYGQRDSIPRKSHCVSFQRIAEHLRNECIRIQAEQNIDLSFTETDLRRAVAAFAPAIGSGSKPHVVIRSDSRKEFDSYRSKAQREADREAQESFFSEFVTVDSALPSLTIAVDGVLTTV